MFVSINEKKVKKNKKSEKVRRFIFRVFICSKWEVNSLRPLPLFLSMGLPGAVVATVTANLIGKCRFQPNHTHTHT